MTFRLEHCCVHQHKSAVRIRPVRVAGLSTAWMYISSLPTMTLLTMPLMLGCFLRVVQLLHTAYQSLSSAESDSVNWGNFCPLLNTWFGSIYPDAESWREVQHLTHGSLTLAEYVQKMRYCRNGITLLAVETGECMCHFQAGLKPAVHRFTVTAPLELGTCGTCMDKP